MITESGNNGAIALSRVDFSGYAAHVTIVKGIEEGDHISPLGGLLTTAEIKTDFLGSVECDENGAITVSSADFSGYERHATTFS